MTAEVLWRSLVQEATPQLAAVGVDNAAQEARWLMERVGGSPEAPATVRGAHHFQQMLERRLTGEPLQYVLGRWGFRKLDLYVDRRVLIPRPETEVLVEQALAECTRLEARVAVDLGTGSGAIALALALERPQLTEVWGTDVSPEALAVARANLAGVGRAASRVRLVEGSWFAGLPAELRGSVDVIVTNPPYVAPEEVADLPDEVRDWEPSIALVSEDAGLADLATILDEAPSWLRRPGGLLAELAPHQMTRARQMARAAGFASVSIWPDLAGRDRILQARL